MDIPRRLASDQSDSNSTLLNESEFLLYGMHERKRNAHPSDADGSSGNTFDDESVAVWNGIGN